MKRVVLALACTSLLLAGCASSRQPKPTSTPMSGLASWYGQEYAGRLTANGEIFDPSKLTAAHRTLPFGTVVRVTNPRNGKSVDVRINDRGPFIANRIIDLSWAAAAAIDMVQVGVAPVELAIVRQGAGAMEAPKPLIVSIPGATPPPPAASPEAPAPAVAAAPIPTGPPSPTSTAERSDSVAARAIRDLGTSTPPPQVDFPVPGGEEPPMSPTAPVSSSGGTASPPAGATPVIIEHEPAPPVAAVPEPATTPKTAPRPAPATSRTAPPAGPSWSIQLGAFGVEENARALQEKVKTVTPNVHVVLVGNLYRVRVGPFTSEIAAIEMRERLDAAGFTTYMISK